jgi:hypothetical protein
VRFTGDALNRLVGWLLCLLALPLILRSGYVVFRVLEIEYQINSGADNLLSQAGGNFLGGLVAGVAELGAAVEEHELDRILHRYELELAVGVVIFAGGFMLIGRQGNYDLNREGFPASRDHLRRREPWS